VEFSVLKLQKDIRRHALPADCDFINEAIQEDNLKYYW